MAIVKTELTCPNGHDDGLLVMMDMPVTWRVLEVSGDTIQCDYGYDDWYDAQTNPRLFCSSCPVPGEFPIPEGFVLDWG